MRGRTLLLNPGPVVLSDRVRAALAAGDACHREPEFAAVTIEVLERLRDVYPHGGRRHAAVLLAGSGTCAVEAMLATLAPRDGITLVDPPEIPTNFRAIVLDNNSVQLSWSAPPDKNDNSVFGDPLFEDPTNDDYRVRPKSPALRVGFENFDMHGWGLQDDFPAVWDEE